MKTREGLRFDGKIAKVVIKRDAKRWFACISVQQPEPKRTSRREVVGVDVGIKVLAYTSRGLSYGNPRPLEAALARLRRLQKAVSRSEKINGREWQGYNLTKLRQEISVLHERIANLRNKWHHEIAAEIVAGVGKVRVETLNISGMLRNRRARSRPVRCRNGTLSIHTSMALPEERYRVRGDRQMVSVVEDVLCLRACEILTAVD